MKRNSNNIQSIALDQIDSDVMELALQNYDNKQISSTLKIPLSTVQRRIKTLYENQFLVSKVNINYKKLGYTQGLLHIYLSDGNLEDILEKVSKITGIISIQVHIGNSDILAGLVYKKGYELLKVITSIKKMDGVENVVWSEQVSEYHIQNRIPNEVHD